MIFNKKKYKYISGCTYFCILKSEKNITLLFGDMHTNFNDMKICDNKNKNILKIYDDSFFKKINKTSNNINIYLENYDIDLKNKTFDTNIRNNKKDYNDIIHYIEYNNQYCFDKKLKDTKCKYKNINWHYADLRKIYPILPLKNFLEIYIDIKKNFKKLKDKNLINNFFNDILSKYKNNSKHLYNFIDFNEIFNILINNLLTDDDKNININIIITKIIKELLILSLNNFKKNYSYKILQKQIKKNIYKIDVDDYVKYIINNIDDDMYNLIYIYYYNLIFDFYNFLINNINKGVKKEDLIDEIKQLIKLINILNFNYDNNLSDDKYYYIYKIFYNKNYNYFEDMIHTFFNLQIYMTSYILDIYYINRSFKYEDSKLNLCYTGRNHSICIKNFLVGNGYYELIYENISTDNNFCLNIEKEINLDELTANMKLLFLT